MRRLDRRRRTERGWGPAPPTRPASVTAQAGGWPERGLPGQAGAMTMRGRAFSTSSNPQVTEASRPRPALNWPRPCVAALHARGRSRRRAPGAAEQRFDDPFAYCAAVGTIDAPDARYAGPAMPDAIARRPQDGPGHARRTRRPSRSATHSIWRCMAGKVYACTFGANLPCQEKADTSRSPTSAMTAFCRDEPERRCHPHGGDRPGHRVRLALRARRRRRSSARSPEPDASGYLANVWYEIGRPEK